MRPILFMLLMIAASLANSSPPDPSLRCFSSLPSDPSLQILRGKISFGSAESQTIAMLTNTQLPSAAERTAIVRWINMYITCDKQAELWRRSNFMPSYVRMYNEFVGNLGQLAITFSQGGMTYSDFSKYRAQQETEFNANAAALVQRFKNAELQGYGMALQAQEAQAKQQQQQQQQRNTAQLQEQQRILNLQQMQLNSQQMQNNQQQQLRSAVGTTTNCYAIGNSIHCNSF